jgi:hypothetical protein
MSDEEKIVYYQPNEFIHTRLSTFVNDMKMLFNIDPEFRTMLKEAHYDTKTNIFKLEVDFNYKDEHIPLNTDWVIKEKNN